MDSRNDEQHKLFRRQLWILLGSWYCPECIVNSGYRAPVPSAIDWGHQAVNTVLRGFSLLDLALLIVKIVRLPLSLNRRQTSSAHFARPNQVSARTVQEQQPVVNATNQIQFSGLILSMLI